jgi:outer membrane lipoprotein-sorting protein
VNYSRNLFCAVALIAPGLRADSLDAILQRMDAAAKSFKSISAKLHDVNYTAVLSESTSEDGELRLRRAKDGLTGILEYSPPDQRFVAFSGHKVQLYKPKANEVTIIDPGKENMSKIDQFILIAFGSTSGNELKSAYDIKLAGTEPVDGKPASHVVLIPKSAEAKKLTTMIELWFPEGTAIAVKEKVTQPTKDYRLTTYSDVKPSPPSPPLPDSAFELKLPAGVKVIKQH